MELIAGSRLGPYEILAPLGAGGMGEVYRAHDTRLDRNVAVKVLPAAFARDTDRIARFEREAKAVAALSHPNILAIHDVGVHEQHTYVVTELLDGQTLRDRLEGGALPVRKAIDVAVQIARGLAAAHDKGIVHRDLKPANVFLLADGQVKILDFGLARQITHGSGATETVAAVTDPGTVMGTVGYMAPEQVRGHAVDARTDLFALGVVLHEMLSGRRAFERATAADTLSALLKEDVPELASERADIPAALDRIVRHSLEKNPAERFQSARDIAFALDALSGSGAASSAVAVIAPNSAWRRRAILLAGAIALVALTASAVRMLWPVPATPLWTGVRLGGPEIAMAPRISPDGNTLAFVAMDANMTQVAVMKPESGNWTILTHKRNAGYVDEMSWAPDGNKIYFDRSSDVPMGVFSVPVLGGAEQLVLEDASNPAVLPDGSLLVNRLNAERELRLFRFWPDTGRLQEFPIHPSTSVLSTRAHVLGDGTEIVIAGTAVANGQSGGNHLYVLELESGRVRRLVTGLSDDETIGAVAVTRDGQSVLVAGSAGSLWRVADIPTRGTAAPRTLLTLTMDPYFLDVGPDGSIYADQSYSPLAVVKFSPRGGHVEAIATTLGGGPRSAAVLPDGRVVTRIFAGGRTRLMVIEAGKDPSPLITTPEDTADPVTAVGPLEVACIIGAQSSQAIALATIANGRITRRIAFDKGPVESLAAAPDGKTLFVGAGGAIWSMPSTGGEPHKIRAGNSVAIDPAGQYLLVQSIETPKTRLFEVPLNGGQEHEIPLNGPFHLTFDPLTSSSIGRDHRLLVPLASPDDWFFPPGVVDLATGRMTRIPVDHFGDYHFLVRTPDGSVIAGALDLRSTLWRFQPEVR